MNRNRQFVTALCLVLGFALLGAADAGTVGIGKRCGTIAGIKCDADLWCEPRAGMCGVADIDGRCVRLPRVCNKIYRPVCGCDNKTYGNDCERRAAKVQKRADGPCK